jgi:membrane dipeptidase
MTAVFDGHNDALTRDDHARLGAGREGGHLDLPRMRAGGMRGGIFAVFTSSPSFEWTEVQRDGGVREVLPAGPVAHPVAAAYAASAAGRLAALERAGEVRIARTAADLDAVRADGDLPPVAVLHLEGADRRAARRHRRLRRPRRGDLWLRLRAGRPRR